MSVSRERMIVMRTLFVPTPRAALPAHACLVTGATGARVHQVREDDEKYAYDLS